MSRVWPQVRALKRDGEIAVGPGRLVPVTRWTGAPTLARVRGVPGRHDERSRQPRDRPNRLPAVLPYRLRDHRARDYANAQQRRCHLIRLHLVRTSHTYPSTSRRRRRRRVRPSRLLVPGRLRRHPWGRGSVIRLPGGTGPTDAAQRPHRVWHRRPRRGW